MSTTAIFAEVLIAGLEAAAWLTLLVLAVFGTGWVDADRLQGWQALTTIAVVAAAYVLGVLVDRFADSAHRRLGSYWPPRPVDKPVRMRTMRIRLLREGGDVAGFFEYQRSRVRVARSTALNALVAAPVAVLFLLRRTDAEAGPALGVGAALLVLAALSELACRRIELAYVRGMSRAYRGLDPPPPDGTPDRAAAIPYRRTAGGLEFLVVGTTGKKPRWTFPKGHVDPDDEGLADAAAREAREEAGIEGRLDRKRLATYPYPRAGEGAPLTVAAFLLEVTAENEARRGKDRTRKVAWCGRDDVVARLAEHRPDGYAEEVEALVSRAVRRLGEA